LVVSLVLACEFVAGLPMRMVNGKPHVISPVGLVPLSCVTELPENGAHIRTGENRQLMVDIYSPQNSEELLDSYNLPFCAEKFLTADSFPADYDGWLAYTSYNNVESIDSFLGYFNVPSAPSSNPDVLYVFTGLQNVDWIPKIDPIPPIFDIIQPVLQYPGDNGDYWSVKSWYVTVEFGVQVTKEIKLNVGDVIFGNMTRTGAESYYIGSTVNSTGVTVGLTATHKALKSQPWAYTTVECYGCNGCATEPTEPIQFTSLSMTSSITPQWTAFQSPNPICDTTAHINSPESVTFTFGSN